MRLHKLLLCSCAVICLALPGPGVAQPGGDHPDGRGRGLSAPESRTRRPPLSCRRRLRLSWRDRGRGCEEGTGTMERYRSSDDGEAPLSRPQALSTPPSSAEGARLPVRSSGWMSLRGRAALCGTGHRSAPGTAPLAAPRARGWANDGAPGIAIGIRARLGAATATGGGNGQASGCSRVRGSGSTSSRTTGMSSRRCHTRTTNGGPASICPAGSGAIGCATTKTTGYRARPTAVAGSG